MELAGKFKLPDGRILEGNGGETENGSETGREVKAASYGSVRG